MARVENKAQQDRCARVQARAALIRCSAGEMSRPTMWRQLLRVAEEYDWIADRIKAESFVAA
jgi:hypothetical protein